jgi:hypothetical protein
MQKIIRDVSGANVGGADISPQILNIFVFTRPKRKMPVYAVFFGNVFVNSPSILG